MGDAAEEDEDVPNAVEEAAGVVGEEVGSGSVEQPLCEDGAKGGGRDGATDRLGDENERPAHDKIEQKGKTRPTVNGCNLIDRAAECYSPKDAKDEPACPTADHADADGGIGGGNHDVNADVVKDAEAPLCLAGQPPVIERAGCIHHQHSTREEGHSQGVLPVAVIAEFQDEPSGREGEENARQMGERVENFFGRTSQKVKSEAANKTMGRCHVKQI